MSSSQPEGAFTRFLERSIAIIREECPLAYEGLVETLRERRIALRVGPETTFVRGRADTIEIDSACADACDVEARTSDAAILALIDGRSALVESIDAEAIDLFGSAASIASFHDALVLYVHGTVRSRSHPALLRAYRADANRVSQTIRGET